MEVLRVPPWVVMCQVPLSAGYLVDELRLTYGGTVDADLVGSGIQQAGGIGQCANASTHGEGDVDAIGYALDELREGVATLLGGTDVEVYQLVGTASGVVAAQLNGVAHVGELLEVYALDRAAFFHVKTGDDSFG